MAIMLNNKNKARRFRPMAEINVTPFVDVMLVLLIVFMVSAPLMTVGVPVDLPKAQAGAIQEKTEPLVISVDKKGKIFIQETDVPPHKLVAKLRAITNNKQDTRIFVRGDRAINYGKVMEIMGMVNQAGFTKVALVTELP